MNTYIQVFNSTQVSPTDLGRYWDWWKIEEARHKYLTVDSPFYGSKRAKITRTFSYFFVLMHRCVIVCQVSMQQQCIVITHHLLFSLSKNINLVANMERWLLGSLAYTCSFFFFFSILLLWACIFFNNSTDKKCGYCCQNKGMDWNS